MPAKPGQPTDPSLVCLGVITGVRGLKGEVRVKSFTGEPAMIGAYGRLRDEQGERAFDLKVTATVKGQVIARIKGVDDRAAAETLKGTQLFVEKAALPEADEDEYYHADLVGLRAELKDGGALGTIRAVLDHGAGAVLEIAGGEGGEILVPFTRDAVPEVDMAAGRVVIDPPPGLMEPAEKEEVEEDAMSEMDGKIPWTAKVLTLYPEMFPGPLGLSLSGQALKEGIWALETVDIRTFARDKHRTVDGPPCGGGPGMVMAPDVVDAAIGAALADGTGAPLIYLTPRGRPLRQERVRELAAAPGVVLLCGRFEGVDERVLEARRVEEVSLGDFVLSGGEPAAVALIDACVRQLPGVMGSDESLIEESFEWGLLEYPQYTRPRDWQGRQVPDILMSGHHEKIRAWRLAQAEEITKARRPDLWSHYAARMETQPKV